MRASRPRLIPGALVLGVLACAVVLSLLRPEAARLDVAGFDAIETGMTDQKVDSALGGPSGDCRTGRELPPVTYPRDRVLDGERQAMVRYKLWTMDGGTIKVEFDGETGLVVEKELQPLP